MNELCRYFGLLNPVDKVANMLDNLCIKPDNKISTYNMDFMHYTFQLGWGNSVLYHRYYQGLPNQIQDPISTQEQEKPTSFQNIYALVMTINETGDYKLDSCLKKQTMVSSKGYDASVTASKKPSEK